MNDELSKQLAALAQSSGTLRIMNFRFQPGGKLLEPGWLIEKELSPSDYPWLITQLYLEGGIMVRFINSGLYLINFPAEAGAQRDGRRKMAFSGSLIPASEANVA